MQKMSRVESVEPVEGAVHRAGRTMLKLHLSCGHTVRDESMDSASFVGTQRECFRCATIAGISGKGVYWSRVSS